METIYIKNMVCPRCIDTVKNIFDELNIKTHSVALAEVVVDKPIAKQELEALNKKLKASGFEVLEEGKSKLINQIKILIIKQIRYSDEPFAVNFSEYLSSQLNYEYSSLSKLFSSIEGVTIEKYVLKQKIELVKELIFYNELSLSEIAFQMGYSSVSHLSAQFKKETGMTPSQFKKLRKPGHASLDIV